MTPTIHPFTPVPLNQKFTHFHPISISGSNISQPTPFVTGAKGQVQAVFFEDMDWVLMKDALHGGRRDTVSFGDLADALPLDTVVLDGGMVQLQRFAADVLPLQPGAPHAGAHSLDDQVAFEFRDGADDHNYGPSKWAAGVSIFPERDIFGAQCVQLIEDLKKVLDRAGYAVRRPNQNHIELAAAGV